MTPLGGRTFGEYAAYPEQINAGMPELSAQIPFIRT
jgi:hypothetical protein